MLGALFVSAGMLAGCNVPDPYTPTSSVVLTETSTPFPASGALPVASKVTPPAQGAYLGAYLPPAPFPLDRVDVHQKETGKSSAIIMWFQPWQPGNRSNVDTAAIIAIMRRGKVPMITWEPWDPGNNARFVVDPGEQVSYRLANINAGVYDEYITQWAGSLRAIGGPIMLRPMHEMNGNWYPWSGTTNGNKPSDFVKAWKHIHDIFVREGATNVTWVWSINHESVPRSVENTYSAYYPGDAYVDWTAISGFNRGTSQADSKWISFRDMYRAPLSYLRGVGKPICISEISTLGRPTARAAWIADAYKEIQLSPEIKAVVYFDSEEQTTEPQDWRIETSSEALAAYSTSVAPQYFIGTPPTELLDWANALSIPQWRYLTAFDPLY
jgi:beta-mannanase